MAFTIIQHRRGTSGAWTNYDPVLAVAEIGVALDTGTVKIGDGVTRWSNLPSLGGGNVDSVNGKTGHVVLTAQDVGAMPAGSDMGGYTRHIVLGRNDPVPEDTEPGTLIFRTDN